ncbi:hypothetical protein [Umezawaea sp. NPDC059074]|uniref:hypothetical protein n=1 Tax=Umezawaea sp. NPDC059074 TaxID=3346716 RepID=UPI0036AA97E6
MCLDDRSVSGFRYRVPRDQRTRIGVLFQQPRLSVDPRMTLIRDHQERTGAGAMAISHDDILLTNWADHTVRLIATGTNTPEQLSSAVPRAKSLVAHRPCDQVVGQLVRHHCVARATGFDPGDDLAQRRVSQDSTQPHRPRTGSSCAAGRSHHDDVGVSARVQAVGDPDPIVTERVPQPFEVPHVVHLGMLANRATTTAVAHRHPAHPVSMVDNPRITATGSRWPLDIVQETVHSRSPW